LSHNLQFFEIPQQTNGQIQFTSATNPCLHGSVFTHRITFFNVQSAQSFLFLTRETTRILFVWS